MESLESKTVPELKELAKVAGIPKYAGMNKGELIAALAKPAESKPAGECPVTDAPCEKSCGPDECKGSVSEVSEKSSPKGSDLVNHPKFDKFKTGGQPT